MQQNNISLMDGCLNATIPKLYETDGISFENKTVHCVYVLDHVQFYWLVVEYDPEQKLAFGYANLNNEDFAEWGYISIEELEENHARKIETWKPVAFPKAKQQVREILDLTRRNYN